MANASEIKFGKQANVEVRRKIADAGLKHYQVAKVVGVNEPTLSRWMHTPMNRVRKARVLDAMDKLKEMKEYE